MKRILVRSSPYESARLSPVVVQVLPCPQSKCETSSVCQAPFALLKYLTWRTSMIPPELCLLVYLNFTFLQASPACAITPLDIRIENATRPMVSFRSRIAVSPCFVDLRVVRRE